MTKNYLKVAIVGRPNVGKSTLFNRLIRRKTAIVYNMPGVTRDYQIRQVDYCGLNLELYDTAGLEHLTKNTALQQNHSFSRKEEPFIHQLKVCTQNVIEQCDVVILVLDSISGITPDDLEFAKWIRQQINKDKKNTNKNLKIIVALNKVDIPTVKSAPQTNHLTNCLTNCLTNYWASYSEALALGFGEPILLSAEHNYGMEELAQRLKQESPQTTSPTEELQAANDSKPLKITIIGQPNAGKSTLINYLLGYQRVITSDVAGTTRDAVQIPWKFLNREIELIDTAGQKQRRKTHEHLEKIVTIKTREIIAQTDVVILVIDGTLGMERQDLSLIQYAIDHGCLTVIAFNKADIIPASNKVIEAFCQELSQKLPNLKDIPCFPIAARKGMGVRKMCEKILELEKLWRTNLSTGVLNRWIAEATTRHQVPMVDSRRPRIKYITQVSSAPPTLALFGNQVDQIPNSYLNYLRNKFRQKFGLHGIPVKLTLKGNNNPYTSD